MQHWQVVVAHPPERRRVQQGISQGFLLALLKLHCKNVDIATNSDRFDNCSYAAAPPSSAQTLDTPPSGGDITPDTKPLGDFVYMGEVQHSFWQKE
eukprot:3480993-Amphidinium_carterae.1